jgi:hypothetical protein
MMPSPKYRPDVSLGSLLQIAVLLIGLGSGYAAIQGQVKANAAAIAESMARIAEQGDQMKSQFNGVELRVRMLENEQARADERFSSIIAGLARIETRLERIDRTGNRP